MVVQRYRSVEEMPAAWRAPDDPGNLHAVAVMLAFHRSLHPGAAGTPGVRRFRTIQEANADRGDPYRCEQPGGEERLRKRDEPPPRG